MTENTFAKLFQVGDHQVLVTKEDPEDEEVFNINFQTQIGGINCLIKNGYLSEETREEQFDKIYQDRAEEFFGDMMQFLGQNQESEPTETEPMD